jgi:hypothetical protein
MNLDDENDETLLRSIVMCEENRRCFHPDVVWSSGWRWYRSPNVIPLERSRALKANRRVKGSPAAA